MRSSLRCLTDTYANLSMVQESTQPPCVSGYGDTSVPPPQKLMRRGALLRTTALRAWAMPFWAKKRADSDGVKCSCSRCDTKSVSRSTIGLLRAATSPLSRPSRRQADLQPNRRWDGRQRSATRGIKDTRRALPSYHQMASTTVSDRAIRVVHLVDLSDGNDLLFGKANMILSLMREQRRAGTVVPRLAVFSPCTCAEAAQAEGFGVDVLEDRPR